MTHDMEKPASPASANGLDITEALGRSATKTDLLAESAKSALPDRAAADATQGSRLRHPLQQPPASERSTFLAELPVDLQRELEELARDVETTATEAMVRMGESLSRARELLAHHPEGGWRVLRSQAGHALKAHLAGQRHELRTVGIDLLAERIELCLPIRSISIMRRSPRGGHADHGH
jgi:hypothetical protein